MGKKFKLFTVSMLVLTSSALFAGGEIKNAVKSNAYGLANSAFSYGNSAIESWARNNLSLIHI